MHTVGEIKAVVRLEFLNLHAKLFDECLFLFLLSHAKLGHFCIPERTYYLDLRITLRQVMRAKIFSWILFHPRHSRLSFYRECLHSLHFNVTANLDVKSEIESTDIDCNF